MFDKSVLKNYLLALDAEIDFQFELILIGGSAAMLYYSAKLGTEDIDTFNNVDRLLKTK